jgi:hypothetical protein
MDHRIEVAMMNTDELKATFLKALASTLVELLRARHRVRISYLALSLKNKMASIHDEAEAPETAEKKVCFCTECVSTRQQTRKEIQENAQQRLYSGI